MSKDKSWQERRDEANRRYESPYFAHTATGKRNVIEAFDAGADFGYLEGQFGSEVVSGLVDSLTSAMAGLIILAEKNCGCESGNAYEPEFICGIHKGINDAEDALTAYLKSKKSWEAK